MRAEVTQELVPEQFPIPGAHIQQINSVFDEAEAAMIFQELSELKSWQRRPILVRDWQTGVKKEVKEGRPTVSFSQPPGKTYEYSGSWRVAEPFPTIVLHVKSRVEELLKPLYEEWSAENGMELSFNYCLANKYEHGLQAVGKHSDDEKDILRRSPIATVSFGAAREFVLESKTDPNIQLPLWLHDGSVMVMAGQTQENYIHSITKDRSIRQPRISLTFRINR